MRPPERERFERLRGQIVSFADHVEALPGIQPCGYLSCLVEQLIESRRRIEFVHHIRDAVHDVRRMDPGTSLFDPLRAAALHSRAGNFDEAHWLVFLAVHFGKHAQDGWRLVRDVYGQLGGSDRWDWRRTSGAPGEFRMWLAANLPVLRGGDGVSRRFSNHRKYESLDPWSASGTGSIVESYT